MLHLMLADPHSSHRHAQRALCINEILARVFAFNDSAAKACCACVCRRWAEPALDALWHVVGVTEDEDEDEFPGLYDLFRLLGPLKEVEVEKSDYEYWVSRRFETASFIRTDYYKNSLQTIDEGISSKSWNRFKYYAIRVRILQTGNPDRMHKSLFRTIGSLKPMPYLFPNLQKYILDLEECGRGEGPARRDEAQPEAADGVTGAAEPQASVLVASSDRIRAELGWSPKKPALEDMVSDAWIWMRASREGPAGG